MRSAVIAPVVALPDGRATEGRWQDSSSEKDVLDRLLPSHLLLLYPTSRVTGSGMAIEIGMGGGKKK